VDTGAFGPLEELARKLRGALETGDLSFLGELLDPEVHWGPPGDPSPPCQTREQVIAWYERAKQSGASARVSEVTVLGDRILVGLVVVGTNESRSRGGHAARWQLLTVRDGRVVDIVGFEQKAEAAAWANEQKT